MKPILSKSIAVSDNRGVFSASALLESSGFVQTNVSYNINKDTFRGMHLQRHPHAQSKLLKVINGSILDIIVDLNEGSDDYGVVQWFDMNQGDEILVPKGFAHGFITKVDHTVVQYLVDGPYVPDADVSINWKSFKDIGLILDFRTNLIISDKDSEALMLNEIKL